MTTTHTITHVHAEAPCGCELPVPNEAGAEWARAADGDGLPATCSHSIEWHVREVQQFTSAGGPTLEWSDRGLYVALLEALLDCDDEALAHDLAWALYERLSVDQRVPRTEPAGDLLRTLRALARAEVALEQFEAFRPAMTHDADPSWIVKADVIGAEVRSERPTLLEALEAVVTEAEGIRVRRTITDNLGLGITATPPA